MVSIKSQLGINLGYWQDDNPKFKFPKSGTGSVISAIGIKYFFVLMDVNFRL